MSKALTFKGLHLMIWLERAAKQPHYHLAIRSKRMYIAILAALRSVALCNREFAQKEVLPVTMVTY